MVAWVRPVLDPHTHLDPIFLPQPSQRCGFEPLWVSMLTVWLSDKGQRGQLTFPLKHRGPLSRLRVNP